VAMLPVAGGAALPAKSPDMAAMSTSGDMSAADYMSDCCPKANPCDKSMADCGSIAACALTCFGLSTTSSSPFLFPLYASTIGPSLASNSYRSRPGTPPFRPPRV
jgi:hypothetical protein